MPSIHGADGHFRGRVVAPDSKEDYVRVPRRLTFFDDVVLRDLRMDSDVGGESLPLYS